MYTHTKDFTLKWTNSLGNNYYRSSHHVHELRPGLSTATISIKICTIPLPYKGTVISSWENLSIFGT